MREPTVRTLDVPEALRLLEDHLPRVGRVGFLADDDRLVILPVNYRLIRSQIAFRTAIGSALDERTRDGARIRVAFQVDALDPAWREGWSVLVQGWAHGVADDDLRALESIAPVAWDPGDKPRFLMIAPEEITGRWIG